MYTNYFLVLKVQEEGQNKYVTNLLEKRLIRRLFCSRINPTASVSSESNWNTPLYNNS